MSEHIHEVRLAFVPGLEPRDVKLTHAHASRPEEPHGHTLRVTIHTAKTQTEEK